MCGTRVLRSLLALVAAVLVMFSYPPASVAQSTDQSMQERMRDLQQQIDQLNQQLKQMQQDQAKTQEQVRTTAQQASATAKESSATAKQVSAADKTLNTFMKGFFGTLDVSIDATTKGIDGLVAYPYSLAPGVTSPSGPFVVTGGPKAPPNGRLSWMGMMSSNGSNIGYRGSHQIDGSDFDFIYQVATALNMVAAPGLQDTWTKSSNTVQGALGLGDTYLGFQNRGLGKLKFGTMFLPYKTSTDRLNPFAGQLGNYSTIMGNTGGDNRIEFGTRADHVAEYNSPTWGGFSFDAAYVFGQNPDSYNNIVALGSTDCYGGNIPGSGNLPLNCDDGGWNWGCSGDLKFELGGLYLTAAYELHSGVNRSSDGVGSNNPYYAYIYGLGPNSTVQCAKGVTCASLLDWSDFLAFENEYRVVGGDCRLARIQCCPRHRQRVGDEVRRAVPLRLRPDHLVHVRGPAPRGSAGPRVPERATAHRRLGSHRVRIQWRPGPRGRRLGACRCVASATPADSTTTTRMASATTRRTCIRSPGGTSWTSS